MHNPNCFCKMRAAINSWLLAALLCFANLASPCLRLEDNNVVDCFAVEAIGQSTGEKSLTTLMIDDSGACSMRCVGCWMSMQQRRSTSTDSQCVHSTKSSFGAVALKETNRKDITLEIN